MFLACCDCFVGARGALQQLAAFPCSTLFTTTFLFCPLLHAGLSTCPSVSGVLYTRQIRRICKSESSWMALLPNQFNPLMHCAKTTHAVLPLSQVARHVSQEPLVTAAPRRHSCTLCHSSGAHGCVCDHIPCGSFIQGELFTLLLLVMGIHAVGIPWVGAAECTGEDVPCRFQLLCMLHEQHAVLSTALELGASVQRSAAVL